MGRKPEVSLTICVYFRLGAKVRVYYTDEETDTKFTKVELSLLDITL